VADYELVVRGSVLDEGALADLAALLRPLSLPQLRKDASEAREWVKPSFAIGGVISQHQADAILAFSESRIASGGAVMYSQWTLTDSQGVTHSERAQTETGPPRDRLTGYTSLRLRMDAAGREVSYALVIQSATGYDDPRRKDTSVVVQAPADEVLALAERVQLVLEERADPAVTAAFQAPPFKVFIGHGTDPQWKYLQRALNDIHGIRAEAFESAERAGYHTLVVVDEMVRTSAVAVVIMTGEDVMEDGTARARENVVHEVGFCQGALGIQNTIVVLEENTSEPSNIAGLTQIRFPRGRLIDVEDKILEALNQRKQAYEFRVNGG
jgi:predicted nucleotide-binding protein